MVIGITHGDINGIGYEVILKTLADNRVYETFTPVIYGSSKIGAYYRKHLDIQGLSINIISTVKEANPKRVNIINCTDEDLKVEFGRATEEAGRASFLALQRATEDLQAGHLHALVTAPVNKQNIQSEQFNFPGQTEYLQQKFGNGKDALMMLTSDLMRVAIATGHIPLRDVAGAITENSLLNKLTVLNESLKQDFGIRKPRIAVLGLNPHAGDKGLIGKEEEEIIIPAMKKASNKGIVCVGPYPADGFFGSDSFKKFDAVLAMYHDQGLIPFKTLSMESGVNLTLGLPIVRTSPDHGTAYELAGKNTACENSFRQALYMAQDIYNRRVQEKEINANPLKPTGIVGSGTDE